MAQSILKNGVIALFLLTTASFTNAEGSSPIPTATTAPKAITTLGCYSAPDPLVEQDQYTFQASGWCQVQCANLNKPVMATTQGSTCYCGDEIPPKSAIVSNSSCNIPCNGYDQENCGGDGFW